MKPDWKDAPEWAKFLAMNANGFWQWYSDEPLYDDYGWSCVHVEQMQLAAYPHDGWEYSLEARPEMNSDNIFIETCLVSDGIIKPTFKLPRGGCTSGHLKYFQEFSGKRIKITLELLEDGDE